MAEFEVPQPIICSPFGEPPEHWLLEEGVEPARVQGRRPSHYFYRAPAQGPGAADGPPAGERIDLPLVNLVRARVQHWRAEGWPGTTGTTLELLEYWRREGREKRLFVAQLEAAETIIRWVSAVNADGRFGNWRFAMARSVAAVRDILDQLSIPAST